MTDSTDARESLNGFLSAQPRSMAELYAFCTETPSTIREHVPLLRELGRRHRYVTEFGSGFSTCALVAGGAHVLTIDLAPPAFLPRLAAISAGRLRWLEADSLAIPTPRPTDLLFIDTWHTYAQLSKELARHAPLVGGRIVLHDTEDFRPGRPMLEQYHPGDPGLWAAVETFLSSSFRWSIERHLTNQHGLTILKRRRRGA